MASTAPEDDLFDLTEDNHDLFLNDAFGHAMHANESEKDLPTIELLEALESKQTVVEEKASIGEESNETLRMRLAGPSTNKVGSCLSKFHIAVFD